MTEQNEIHQAVCFFQSREEKTDTLIQLYFSNFLLYIEQHKRGNHCITSPNTEPKFDVEV